MTPELVMELFKKITDEQCLLLGLNPEWARPDWMILSVLPVPPMPVRPAVKEGERVSQDDLTFCLLNIVKANNALKKHEMEGAPAHIVQEFEALLQYHVATFMNNDLSSVPQSMHKSGRPYKTIRARLKGKEGIFLFNYKDG
jgi:DNA-directed RNA polymerase II subunit RPB1